MESKTSNMAQEIKRKHKLGKTIQNSNFGQGHSWLFEGEGDPSTGTSLEIQKLSDVNAPIGSNFLDLVTGTSYVKIDSTPNENRGLYKVGVWAAVSGGTSDDDLLSKVDKSDLPTKTTVGAIKADYDATTSTLEISIDGTDIL